MANRRVMVVMALLILFSGCASTKKARKVETSGFLADYSMLTEGEKGEALLRYVNPEAHWAAYHKILLDPVMVWSDPETQQELPNADLQRMADFFYAVLHQQLSQDYQMVDKPGPGTMRLQVALTHAHKSNPALVLVSSIPAPMNVLAVGSLVTGVATGKPLFVGDVSCEGKITDAQTGQLLGAAVDRRVGTKTMRSVGAKKFESWGDVEEALRFWAERLRYNLCRARSGANCVSPDA
ncbi:MAG: DUF3313 domain-containing protein [bacterium]